MYRDRFYRENFSGERFRSAEAKAGESDIWIGWNAQHEIDEVALGARAGEILSALRDEITGYARGCPGFLRSFEPLPLHAGASPLVRAMSLAAEAAGTGPMAAVAGAIAEYLGRALDREFHFDEIVVENGGDFWIKIFRPLSIGIYAGLSSLSGKIALSLDAGISPLGLACSSGTVGPSFSYGKADAALVIAEDAAAADAWASALGNRVKGRKDLEAALRWLIDDAGGKTRQDSLKPLGALVILGDTLAAQGCIRLGPAS